ncbi:MAG: hypothetical protein IKA65_06775 [Lentisphaeria bacterium]|nr:hypothetical protein [Lentisphaeria bacterium]
MRITTVIFAMMAAFTLSAAEEVNLIKNGNFAEGTKFWHVSPQVKHVAATGKDGKNFVVLTNQRSVRQLVAIEPDGIYELTFLIKGENIVAKDKSQGGRVIIRGGKRYARGTANADGSCMTGSFDWKQGKCTLKASYFKSPNLEITLWLAGDGKCCYTDVKFVKVGSEKKAQ